MSTTPLLRLATAQYEVGFIESWTGYAEKIHHWVHQAVAAEASLLLFPEYFSMELAALFGKSVYSSLSRQLAELQTVLPEFLGLFQALAQKHGIYILAGSFPVQIEDGYRNRAHLFWPDGRSDFQEKLQMTRFENEQWHILPGTAIKTFDTVWGKIAVNICYDSEFPLIARRQAEMGASLILVPSCTDTYAGYNRVKIGCQARALENQCYVAQSPTVGNCGWSEAIDVNIGAAGLYTPVDYGYPSDGVLVKGELNDSGWVYGDLDLTAIETVRRSGQVFNYRDWTGQYRLI